MLAANCVVELLKIISEGHRISRLDDIHAILVERFNGLANRAMLFLIVRVVKPAIQSTQPMMRPDNRIGT